MVSKKGLEQLGIRNPQIGSAITLLVDENQTTFTLSGWFQDYGFRTNNYDSYISENYLNKLGKTAASDGTLYLSSKRFMERKLLDEIDKITLNTDQTITASCTISQPYYRSQRLPVDLQYYVYLCKS